MQTRIYVVLEKATGNRRLVEASSTAQAIRHCVKNAYEAKVANTKDIAGLMQSGLHVEKASAESAKAEVADAPAEAEASE